MLKDKVTMRIEIDFEKAVALRDRLIPISPSGYNLETHAFLRNLYSRLDHIILGLAINPKVNHIQEMKKWRCQRKWSEQADCPYAKGDNYPHGECLAPNESKCRANFARSIL